EGARLLPAEGPERVRPLLCPDDADRRRRHPRCCVGDAVMNFPWLTTLLVLPLLGALVVALLPRSSTAVRPVALGFSLLTLAVGVALTTQFRTGSDEPFQLTEVHSWIPQFGVSYALGIDGISLTMILLGLVLVPICIVAAWDDVPAVDRRQHT